MDSNSEHSHSLGITSEGKEDAVDAIGKGFEKVDDKSGSRQMSLVLQREIGNNLCFIGCSMLLKKLEGSYSELNEEFY